MRQRKLGFLLVALLVAFGLLFTGGEARANFTAFKYGIAATPLRINDNTATYTYVFTKEGNSSTAIKNILFELPAELYSELNSSKLTAFYDDGATGSVPLPFLVIAPGLGHPDTRLGLGNFDTCVLQLDPSATGFSKDGFTIVLYLTEINISGNKRLSVTKTQVVQLKSQNNATDSDAVYAPTLEDIPSPQPTNVSITPTPLTIGYGTGFECSNLFWTATDGDIVAISGFGLVREPGSDDIYPAKVCPEVTTPYKITAIGLGGSADASDNVTVIQPPPPVIEGSQETIEKKDEATGEVTGYVTFYSLGGVLECACSTGPTNPILPYDQACGVSADCVPASEADSGVPAEDNPLLVCVVGGQTTPTCDAIEGEYCTTILVNDKNYKCNKLALPTNAAIIEIGENSCTCGWRPTINRYGKITYVYSCTGDTCP